MTNLVAELRQQLKGRPDVVYPSDLRVWSPASGRYEALQRAATPTLERMREDRERLPHQLSALIAYLEEHLCDPDLNVTRAMRATKVRNHSLQALFRAHTDTTLRSYIEVARLEIADRLLRLNQFEVGRISISVGFGCHATFLRAFKAWADELPSEVGRKTNPPEIDYPNWRKTWRRELSPDVARDYLARYVGLYPEAGKLVPDLGDFLLRARTFGWGLEACCRGGANSAISETA